MTPRKKTSGKKTANQESADYWRTKQDLDKQNLKLFLQEIYRDWCKACGICIAFCPKTVFKRGKDGKPEITRPDDCIGCRFCELHCPDFAISIKERYPDRRKKTNGR